VRDLGLFVAVSQIVDGAPSYGSAQVALWRPHGLSTSIFLFFDWFWKKPRTCCTIWCYSA
jgi:hypothetical protein